MKRNKAYKTIPMLVAALALSFGLAACGNAQTQPSSQATTEAETQASSQTQESSQEKTSPQQEATPHKRVAKDGASMQTEDATMPTRLPMEGGTKINMYFGDTVIPGVLNDSDTAKALIQKLPLTQHVSRYAHDFCGTTEELPYSEDEVHYGWLNGDIDYATDAPYFTILFEDEDVSEQYGYQVNIGVITCPIEDIANLEGSFDVRIELAE